MSVVYSSRLGAGRGCVVSSRLCQLAARLCNELKDLDHVVGRVQEGWRRVKLSSDDYYLDGVALNLHSFYAGLERMFELIAVAIDGGRPEGENWHQALLLQVSTESPPARPAVISESVRRRLDEYRGFRHVVRNVYTFKFDAQKIEKLVEDMPFLFTEVRAEIGAFAEFLKHRG